MAFDQSLLGDVPGVEPVMIELPCRLPMGSLVLLIPGCSLARLEGARAISPPRTE